MSPVLIETNIEGLPRRSSGKVRDIYELPDCLLLIATDRISAYDVVMPNGIPDKGRVLTHLSRFWFLQLRPFVANHYITYDSDFVAARLAEAGVAMSASVRAQIHGRSMLVLKAAVIPIECVVRGYMAGSLWKEYMQADGPSCGARLHGIDLPPGLRESDRLPEPLFTPATKATSGHDENISFHEMRDIVGTEDAAELRRISLDIYRLAAARALGRGIILADTKFEFGIHSGSITLIDEVLTPDSSRFWDARTHEPGRPQPSFDKQYLRDWLSASGWNREPPAPRLPDDVVANTSSKYREAYRRIVGQELPA
jgi:phosphoribosylaminoimidazole-succinocarboxamide synthase